MYYRMRQLGPGNLSMLHGHTYRSISQVFEHVWCDLADDEVVHPIRRSCNVSAQDPSDL